MGNWCSPHSLLTTAQEILPPTLALQAWYTLCLVAPVARNPTKRIIRPMAAMPAPSVVKTSWTASNLKTILKMNIGMIESVADCCDCSPWRSYPKHLVQHDDRQGSSSVHGPAENANTDDAHDGGDKCGIWNSSQAVGARTWKQNKEEGWQTTSAKKAVGGFLRQELPLSRSYLECKDLSEKRDMLSLEVFCFDFLRGTEAGSMTLTP